MASIQGNFNDFNSQKDTSILPKELDEILVRVQNNAHYMPDYQLNTVMTNELGADWKLKFKTFDTKPIAAGRLRIRAIASIGQVHQATLTESDRKVAVKVQYP